MPARLPWLLVVLGLLLGSALPSDAAAVVRLPTSHESATSPVPDRNADPVYASSYFGARYYRAEIGRFTTIDPLMTISENIADPQRWNRYAYALNNPLKFTDPDGKIPVPVILAGAAAASRWLASPQGQRLVTAAVTAGQDLWIAGTRFFNSPAGQETIQTIGELITGAEVPRLSPNAVGKG